MLFNKIISLLKSIVPQLHNKVQVPNSQVREITDQPDTTILVYYHGTMVSIKQPLPLGDGLHLEVMTQGDHGINLSYSITRRPSILIQVIGVIVEFLCLLLSHSIIVTVSYWSNKLLELLP